jgi:cytochrome P450
MLVRANIPVVLQWPAAALWYLRFARDPIQAITQSYATHGPFLKLPYPRVRTKGIPRAFVVAIGPEFNRQVLGNPTAWRPINVGPPGRRNSTVRRLNRGILGMSGGQHQHYRRFLVPPLQRIDARVSDMIGLAEEQVDSWPQQIRVAQEDTSLNGYPLARRTKVLLSPFLTNRDPDLYPDADQFRPDRWATIAPSPYEYSVFSGGPRGCPGSAFALAILKVAIATIVARYRIALQPGTRVDYKIGVALTPRRAIPAVLHRHNGAFAASSIRGRIRDLVRFPG